MNSVSGCPHGLGLLGVFLGVAGPGAPRQVLLHWPLGSRTHQLWAARGAEELLSWVPAACTVQTLGQAAVAVPRRWLSSRAQAPAQLGSGATRLRPAAHQQVGLVGNVCCRHGLLP